PSRTPVISPLSLHDALPIFHDDACQPADDAADDQPDDDSHACLPVSGGTPVRSAGHAGSGIVTAMSAAARRTGRHLAAGERRPEDRKSTRLNSSHVKISYAV